MTSPRSTAAGLSLEDFRRLGVRPQEYRLTVIRQAAARSTRGLASQQLSAPTDQAGLQLSRVATSAYRLLDPRRRHDTQLRARVGRILPHTLSWASQTRFHSELTDFGSSPTNTGRAPFERSSLSDAELIEMIDLESSSKSKQPHQPDWTSSLSDVDLLNSTPMSRRVARLQSPRHIPWFRLAAAGLAGGVILGFAVHHSLKTDSASRPKVQVAVEANASVEPDAEANVQSLMAATNPGADSPSDQKDPANQNGAVTTESGVGQGAALVDVATSTPSVPSPKRQLVPDELRELFKVDPFEASVEVEETPAWDLPPTKLLTDQIAVDLPDSSQRPQSWKNTDERPLTAPSVAETQTPDLSSRPVSRWPVPSDASLRRAKRELLDLMPLLNRSVEAENASQRIEELELVERQFEAGSAEHWVAHVWIAEAAWLIEATSQVEQRLVSLVAQYDVASSQLMAETFLSAASQATQPTTRIHVLDNGLRLADQLLIEASPSSCSQVVDKLSGFAAARPSETEQVREYLLSYTEAANMMGNHADAVVRAKSQEDGPSPADRKVLGRYYCLMLRRWNEGLEMLTKVSNGQIARAARMELRLGVQPSADEIYAVTKQWVTAAAHASGRPANSIRLHVIDLLGKAQPQATGLTKLHIDRQLEDVLALIPSHLLPAEAAGFGMGDNSQGNAPSLSLGAPLF